MASFLGLLALGGTFVLVAAFLIYYGFLKEYLRRASTKSMFAEGSVQEPNYLMDDKQGGMIEWAAPLYEHPTNPEENVILIKTTDGEAVRVREGDLQPMDMVDAITGKETVWRNDASFRDPITQKALSKMRRANDRARELALENRLLRNKMETAMGNYDKQIMAEAKRVSAVRRTTSSTWSPFNNYLTRRPSLGMGMGGGDEGGE